MSSCASGDANQCEVVLSNVKTQVVDYMEEATMLVSKLEGQGRRFLGSSGIRKL